MGLMPSSYPPGLSQCPTAALSQHQRTETSWASKGEGQDCHNTAGTRSQHRPHHRLSAKLGAPGAGVRSETHSAEQPLRPLDGLSWTGQGRAARDYSCRPCPWPQACLLVTCMATRGLQDSREFLPAPRKPTPATQVGLPSLPPSQALVTCSHGTCACLPPKRAPPLASWAPYTWTAGSHPGRT